MKDYTGQKFNRLTAVEFAEWRYFKSGKRQQVWWFLCECGTRIKGQINNAVTGHTKSCGCGEKENLRALMEVRTTHGHSGRHPHPLYTVWCSMRQRCCDVNHKQYPDWGGRGIKILWTRYEDFYRDMSPGYQPGLTIERINNDGNYEPGNCKWATYKEQNLNRRSNRKITFHGKTQPLSVWAWESGLKPMTLAWRINHGWSTSRALTEPVNRSKSWK